MSVKPRKNGYGNNCALSGPDPEGEKTFNTLAVLYSEDASAPRGGELGYKSKKELDPAFCRSSFQLKTRKISKIIESEYGFHIIQLIDRQGEKSMSVTLSFNRRFPIRKNRKL